MNEDELSALTVAELKARLKELGLTIGGKKADLIARLVEADEEEVLILEEDEDDSTSESEPDDDEILEAEVFDAEIIEAEEILEQAISKPRTTGPAQIRAAPDFPRNQWYRDGTAIATILVVLCLREQEVGGTSVMRAQFTKLHHLVMEMICNFL